MKNGSKRGDKPLDDGRHKFFINKQGDIMELSLAEQARFLRKYYECEPPRSYWRGRNPEWSIEEFPKTTTKESITEKGESVPSSDVTYPNARGLPYGS